MRSSENVYELEVADYTQIRNQHPKFAPALGDKKKVSILPELPHKTIFVRAKDHDKAQKKGERFGTILSCQKVDTCYYLNKIEHLNLNQEPLTMELQTETEFVLNKAMELTMPQKEMTEKKYDIELVDRGI